MRALGLICGAVMWIACANCAYSQQSTEALRNQIASCPAIFPVLAGEKSVVVPSLASPQVMRVASRQTDVAPDRQSARLQQRIAERDRLQREITELRTATKTPEQILVRVKMLEVNVTKLRELGIGRDAFVNGKFDDKGIRALLGSDTKSPAERPVPVSTVDSAETNTIASLVTTLQQKNCAKVLAEPSIVVAMGRPASFNVGGEFPVPSSDNQAAEFRKYGTQVDLLALSLGDNRVRLEVRPRVTELDLTRSIRIGSTSVPGLIVREVDFAREIVLGETAFVAGLIEERVESEITESGVRNNSIEIALLVVVTPELVN